MTETEENGWIVIHSEKKEDASSSSSNNVKIEIVVQKPPTPPVPETVPEWMVQRSRVQTFGVRMLDDIPVTVPLERVTYNPAGLAWLAHQMNKNNSSIHK